MTELSNVLCLFEYFQYKAFSLTRKVTMYLLEQKKVFSKKRIQLPPDWIRTPTS